MKVRLIHDESGWTQVRELPHENAGGIAMPFEFKPWVYFTVYFKLSGERDAEGLPIFRTRVQ